VPAELRDLNRPWKGQAKEEGSPLLFKVCWFIRTALPTERFVN